MPKCLFVLFFSIPLFAKAQTADFNIQSASSFFCNPATIRFTQNCTGSPIGFLWDFGNNSAAYSGDVSVTYTSAGTFTIKLIAIYDQTTVEVSKIIVINPAVITSIGYDKNYICAPGAIQFTATSNSNIVNNSWDFGDASGTQIGVTNSILHNYTKFGNYSVMVKATDDKGCSGIGNTTINVVKPAILASVSPTNGCIPAIANFNATVNVPVSDFVTNYTWDFGDGSPLSSTTTNIINHTYSAVGSYSPTLSIITNDGCLNSYNFPPVAYGTPPSNHIAYAKKAVVCGNETAVFISNATNAGSYVWDYGDGNTGTVTDTITQHKYTTLGIKTIAVTPYFNGCPGTTINFQIEIVGVIAGYNYSNTCTNKKTYTFNNTSFGNLSAVLWKFGDGSPDVLTTNATHTFPVSGQFITSLKVTDSVTGCSDSYSQTIYTADPLLVNLDTTICKNTSTSFSIAGNYTNTAALYTWNVLGAVIGPSPGAGLAIKAPTLGNFNNFVTINYGPQSCPDTLQLNHSILVKGPDLKFSAPSSVCLNTLFSVSNSSTPFIAADSIKRWYWNFGNSLVNDTIYQPAPFQYKSSGTFNVMLTGIDINGCKDSLAKSLTVNPIPFLRVVPKMDTLCLGQSASLRAFSSDKFLWTPVNNISCVDCDSIVANPTLTTKYYVNATTSLNCNIKDSVLVKVYTPFTTIAPTNVFFICVNEQVQLDIEPKMKKVIWSPAAGLSNSTIYNPLAFPLQRTTYTANLVDSVGCFSSSASIDVIVKSLPTVNAGPDKIVSANSTYTIAPAYSNNVSQYEWTPATLLNCKDCPAPNGTALHSENFTIKVISDSGCVATDSIIVYVECKNSNIMMPKAFTPNNDNLNEYYYPITRGIKTILKFIIYNRQGQIMYEAKNFIPNTKSFAWNGQFKGQAQAASAYVYTLEAICELGERISKTGSFLLIR